MTITDENVNAQSGSKASGSNTSGSKTNGPKATTSKSGKSQDSMAALRQAMEERMGQPSANATNTPPPASEREPPPQNAPAADPADLSFNPILWGGILMRVTGACQEMIRNYIQRMRDRPIETTPINPLPLMDSLTALTKRVLEDPEVYTEAQLAMWQHGLDITRMSLARMQGGDAAPIMHPPKGDKRFQGQDWQKNWLFDFLKQYYLSTTDETRRLVRHEATHINDKLAKKIEFYTRLFLDATAPSNFWLTNPEVLRATIDSQGENLIKGFANLLADLESGNGTLRIRMSDYKSFEVGVNIATTPGQVIFQNDLTQLIQYAPSTPDVRRVPLLILPPWINKFYILDLREKNSLIRYLVAQGFTVFCISWVNPVKRHALTQFEDYMEKGALAALREVKRATGADQVNVAGYCIGGTLLACTQAYLAAQETPDKTLPTIASATYLTAMIDFSNPGDLGVFIDDEQIALLEDRMARQGFLDAGSLMMTFNLLRANDLIWPFVINNYLLGREPFPFDILYWNTDGTHLPAAMQSYYLRKMYLENKLVVPGALKMKQTPLDLGLITTPTFMLSTREDHIAPWQSTYRATQIYKGPVTFVLSGSGHIAGVVNPPAAEKYGYWMNSHFPSQCPPQAETWLQDATEHKGSWWPQWVKWLESYAGEMIPARQITNGIEAAPGSYVKVRAV